MRGEWSNEELAERIQNGEKDLLPLLWGNVRGFINLLALKHRYIIQERAYVDVEDLIQCGYFAMLKAVEAYDSTKGCKFVSFIVFKYKNEIYKLIGAKKTKCSYIFPPFTSSLNATVENDDHETELVDMLEDENAESIETDYEKKEMQRIVRAAVGRLPELERNVIQEIYFNERAKTEIADGRHYKDQFAVTRAEDRALHILRKDKTLQALHTAYFKNMPRQKDIFKSSAEEAVIEDIKWETWFENIIDDIGRIENGL